MYRQINTTITIQGYSPLEKYLIYAYLLIEGEVNGYNIHDTLLNCN